MLKLRVGTGKLNALRSCVSDGIRLLKPGNVMLPLRELSMSRGYMILSVPSTRTYSSALLRTLILMRPDSSMNPDGRLIPGVQTLADREQYLTRPELLTPHGNDALNPMHHCGRPTPGSVILCGEIASSTFALVIPPVGESVAIAEAKPSARIASVMPKSGRPAWPQ
jgi:hypothetical protein